jgi:curved DNA-binding protein CbpA
MENNDSGIVDYYEFLQISPNAELDTIHRVYRFLAARLHPDNPGSGDPEQFKLLKKAYDVLSDGRQRASYDATRSQLQQRPYSSSVDFMDNLEGELNRRMAVLAVLYHKRRTCPHAAEVTLGEIEKRMGFPRDYLDFTLWYLHKKAYITRADNAQFTLTAEGVDFVEKERDSLPTLNKLLTAGSDLRADGIARAHQQSEADSQPEPGSPNSETPGSKPIVLPSSMDSEYDRRSSQPDRRVGLPDPQKVKTERRHGTRDRRANPGGKPRIN